MSHCAPPVSPGASPLAEVMAADARSTRQRAAMPPPPGAVTVTRKTSREQGCHSVANCPSSRAIPDSSLAAIIRRPGGAAPFPPDAVPAGAGPVPGSRMSGGTAAIPQVLSIGT